ncbi:MAG: hypothetical protein KIT80_06995 [Chitinophagaceae bacterium]|nr:hypothetical protein [Chitinophagaceae bacterium]MCW5926645.1 hypothetical protein [Chitinophagaceae bacterium]
MKKKLATEIIKTGLLAGTLDILLAFGNAWWSARVSPGRVLRFIASGLIGTKAFSGPQSIMLLGLVLHFVIAFCWTAAFFLLYPKIPGIVRHKILQAVLYGIVVWVIMNGVVLPVSSVPASGFQWSVALKGMLILIVAIGLPVVHFAGRYWRKS